MECNLNLRHMYLLNQFNQDLKFQAQKIIENKLNYNQLGFGQIF